MQTVKIIVVTVALAAMVIAHTTAANSITYVVGNWQITLTDLGVLPGGTASRALAINNVGRIVGLATDSTFALQRPFWDAISGAITGFAENFDPASTAVPEQIDDSGQMVGTEDYGGRLYRGVFWNPQGQAFGLPPLAGVDPLYGSRHVKGHGINNLGQMVGASKMAPRPSSGTPSCGRTRTRRRRTWASSARVPTTSITARRTASTTSPMSSATARSAR